MRVIGLKGSEARGYLIYSPRSRVARGQPTWGINHITPSGWSTDCFDLNKGMAAIMVYQTYLTGIKATLFLCKYFLLLQ